MILLLVACLAEDEPPYSEPYVRPEPVEAPADLWFRDADGDGYGDRDVSAPAERTGYVARPDDCDDADPAVHPDGIEVGCDFADNDCSSETRDDLGGYCHFADADQDGWGDAARGFASPNGAEPGASRDHGDCDDADPSVFPGAEDRCFDDRDDDCDSFDCGSDLQAPYGATAIVEGPIGFGDGLSRLGDVDGDGAEDVWVRQWGRYPTLWSNEGTVEATSAEPWGGYLVAGGADAVGRFVEANQHILAEGAWDADGDGGRDLWLWEPNGPAIRTGSDAFLAGSSAAGSGIDLGSDYLRGLVTLDDEDATVAAVGWETLYLFADDAAAVTRGPADARTTVAMANSYQVWLVGPGDLDGDGRDDILLTDTEYAFVRASADLPSGTLAVDDLESIPWPSPRAGGGGFRLSPVGDVDGDGLRDFAHSGCVYAGGPRSWSEPYATSVEALDEAGDVNGDGYTDVLYGQGVAFGPIAGAIEQSERIGIAPVTEGTGFDVRESDWMPLLAIGDVDGDGYDDLYTATRAMGGRSWTGDGYPNGAVSEGPGRLWLIPGYAVR